MNLFIVISTVAFSLFIFIDSYALLSLFENLTRLLWQVIIVSNPFITAYVLRNDNKHQLNLIALILNTAFLILVIAFIFASAYKQSFTLIGVVFSIVVFSLPLLINIRALSNLRK